MKVIIIISVAVLLVAALCALYMRVSCKGLWEKQVSKIPAGFLSIFPKKEGQPDDYSKCVYVGFRAMFDDSRKEAAYRNEHANVRELGQAVNMKSGLRITLKEIIVPKTNTPGDRTQYRLVASFKGLSHEFLWGQFNDIEEIKIHGFPVFRLTLMSDNSIRVQYVASQTSADSTGSLHATDYSKKIVHADRVTSEVLWTATFNTDPSDPAKAAFTGEDGKQTNITMKTYVDEKNGFAFEYPEFQGSVTDLLDYEKPSIRSENISVSYLHYRHRLGRFPSQVSSEGASEEIVTDRYIEIKVHNKTVPAEADMPLNAYGIPRSRSGSSFVVNYDNHIYVKIPENDGVAWFSKSFIEYLVSESIRPIDQRDATFQNRQKAIGIAEKKIIEKYPNFRRSDHDLLLIEAGPVKGMPGKWFVKYDVEESTDASVMMIVDIDTGEITDYQDSWA